VNEGRGFVLSLFLFKREVKNMFYRARGIDSRCSKCSLSYPPSVFGQSEVPLEEVKLVIISAYPSTEEIRQGISLAPSSKVLNAGAYCRKAISTVFDQDPNFPMDYKPFVMSTFFTNMIKCPAQVKKEKREVKIQHIRSCRSWLEIELEQLHPKVPLLIASSEAVKGLIGEEEGLYGNRNKRFLVGEHPALITMNPIEPSRYTTYTAKDFKRNREGVVLPKGLVMDKPLMGSIPWLFKKDLIEAKKMVLEFIEGEADEHS
jgi:hypothetical protein